MESFLLPPEAERIPQKTYRTRNGPRADRRSFTNSKVRKLVGVLELELANEYDDAHIHSWRNILARPTFGT